MTTSKVRLVDWVTNEVTVLCKERDELRKQVKKLTDALRELYDCQNRTPLPGRREKAWNEAMAIAGKILMESQNVDE